VVTLRAVLRESWYRYRWQGRPRSPRIRWPTGGRSWRWPRGSPVSKRWRQTPLTPPGGPRPRQASTTSMGTTP